MNQGIFKIVLQSRFLVLLPVLRCGESFLPGKKESGVASTHTLLGRRVRGLQVFYNAVGLASKMGKHLLRQSSSAEAGSLKRMQAGPVHG